MGYLPEAKAWSEMPWTNLHKTNKNRNSWTVGLSIKTFGSARTVDTNRENNCKIAVKKGVRTLLYACLNWSTDDSTFKSSSISFQRQSPAEKKCFWWEWPCVHGTWRCNMKWYQNGKQDFESGGLFYGWLVCPWLCTLSLWSHFVTFKANCRTATEI